MLPGHTQIKPKTLKSFSWKKTHQNTPPQTQNPKPKPKPTTAETDSPQNSYSTNISENSFGKWQIQLPTACFGL